MPPTTMTLTPAEKRLCLWMRLSFLMYAFGAPLFLLFGRQLAAFLNGLPHSLTQQPPWPPAGTGMEVVFWQVLGVSLMVILAFVCLYIARDVRRYGPMIIGLLGAKLMSTACYVVLFVMSGNWAFLIAAVTDGAIFLLSWVLWFLASPADRFLDAGETRVLTALGETLLPREGPYPEGYEDVQDACLAGTRQFLNAQPPIQVVLTRLMLRTLDLLPLILGRFKRFHRLTTTSRTVFFEGLEHSRISLLRMMAIALKLYVVTPFFNLPEMVERITGNDD